MFYKLVTFQDRIEEIFPMSVTFQGQINVATLYCKLWLSNLLITWTFLQRKMTATGIYVFKKFNFWKGRLVLKVVRTFHFFFYLLCISSQYVLLTKTVYFGEINFLYHSTVLLKIIRICLSQKLYRTYPTSMNYLVNVYWWKQSVQSFNSLLFFVAKSTQISSSKTHIFASHWFWRT